MIQSLNSVRQDRNNDCDIEIRWAPEGKRPKKTRRSVEKERKQPGWNSWKELRTIAEDRERGRTSEKQREKASPREMRKKF